MSRKRQVRSGDRVMIQGGQHHGEQGTVLRREGSAWQVRLDSGATRTCMASSLNKLPCSLRKAGADGLG